MCRQLSRQMCRQLSCQMCRQMSQLKQLKEVAAVGSRRSTRSHSRRSMRWQSRLVISFTSYKRMRKRRKTESKIGNIVIYYWLLLSI